MDKTDVAAILANLPDDCEITVTVKLKDWLAAKEAARGGPEYASAADVARLVGLSPTYWGRRAKAGKIAGAVQDESGRWRLPLEACRNYVRGLKRPPAAAPSAPKEFRFRTSRAVMAQRRAEEHAKRGR